MTFADFVDHVPTSCASMAAKIGVNKHAPRSRDCIETGGMVRECVECQVVSGSQKSRINN